MVNSEQAPVKQGLPVWAWVGIGCGGLLILVLVIAVVGMTVIWNKGKGFVEEFEKNPELTVARAALKANPEWEEVVADEAAGTITVRNTDTGEEITVDFDEIKKGKISFKSGEREIKVDASGVGESGTVKVTDDEGGVIFSTGEVSGSDIPSWVPVYPGTEPASRHSMTTETTLSGGFELETADPVAQVLEHYRSALAAEGYELKVNTYTQDDTRGGMVNGTRETDQRNIVVIVNAAAGGPTKISVEFSDED
jgi:hypothetical protein